jgi:hypothetical protein
MISKLKTTRNSKLPVDGTVEASLFVLELIDGSVEYTVEFVTDGHRTVTSRNYVRKSGVVLIKEKVQ